MKTFQQSLDSIATLGKNNEFMSTGIASLDEDLDGGFMRKELVIIGGNTGSGKSFLSGQIFHHIATQGFKSAYFSLEISNEMIVSRLIGQISNIKPTRIMCGLLSKSEMSDKRQAENKIRPYEDLMFFYDDVYHLNKITEEISVNKYDFIVIDFIQNLITGQKDEYAAMSLAALELQKVAKATNSCILVVSQLSNAATTSQRIEYKGSGGIAMVADLGFFIIRPSMEEVASKAKESSRFQLALRKNRRGVSGIAYNLNFKDPGGRIL